MKLHGLSFIAGKPVADSAETFTATNPATGEALRR